MWNLSIAKAKLVPLSAEGSQACAPIMKGEEAGRQKCKQQRRTGTLKGEGSEGRMERIQKGLRHMETFMNKSILRLYVFSKIYFY